ncbi:MAG: PorV/PorQ family protein [Spirochaetia bacterium]|nr:PorV/PorQ family protein [Spirochaetia bacterium]
MGKQDGKIILTVLCLLLTAGAYAAGDTGADILRMDSGARPIAMGGAYTALGDDVESAGYNPAGLATITLTEMQANYNSNLSNAADVNVVNVSWAQPLVTAFIEGNIGLSGMLRFIPGVSNPDAVDEAVPYYDFYARASYAVRLDRLNWFQWDYNKYISAGLSLGMVLEQIGSFSYSTVTADLGAIMDLFGSGFKAGAVIQNIGPDIGSAPLPSAFRFGLAHSAKIDKDNTLNSAIDYIQDFRDYPRFAAGVEDNIMNIFAIRLGYNQCVDTRSPSYASAGAGMAVSQLGFTAIINYAYRVTMWNGFTAVDHNHLVSIQIKI